MELLRETIVLNKHIGREMTQILLEGDIIVPDTKPDISSILKTDAQIVVLKINPMAGRISYSGKLDIKILYMARDGESIVHSISTFAPVDDFLNMEGVGASTLISFNARIAHIDYRVVNDRKLNYRAVVDVVVAVSENASADVVKGIADLPPAQQKTAALSLNNNIAKKFDEFTIKDEIILPGNKPAVDEMLSVSIAITGKEVRVGAGHVDISGALAVMPLYRGDAEGSIIELAEFELPFSGAIDVQAAQEGNFGDVHLRVLESTVHVQPDEEGEHRILAIEAIIGADIHITDNHTLSVLDDAYCIDQNLDIKRVPLEYQNVVCRNKNQFNVKEAVKLEDAPEMLQILSVDGIAHLEDKKVIDDKVVVEGVVMANILYVANSDITPLYSYQAALPIRQVVETKGTRLGMDADVEQSIERISFSMLAGNEVELRFALNVDVLVQEDVRTTYISDIDFSPHNSETVNQMPSMVVLCTQKGDSLWSIAKKYNASLEELAAINELDSTAELAPGQKLLVVKKVAGEGI